MSQTTDIEDLEKRVAKLEKKSLKKGDSVQLVLTDEAGNEWILTTEGVPSNPKKINAVAFQDSGRTWELRERDD